MSLSPAVLDALLAAGATAEMIVAAVKADLAGQEERIANKRAKDAERQRKSRSNRAGHDVSRNVTVTECDVTETDPLSLPPNEKISNPPTHTPENNTPTRKGPIFVCPEGVDQSVWADFLKARKTKGCTNSATAYAKVLRDIAAVSATTGEPPGRVVEECAARGWASINDWTESRGKPQNGTANRTNSASYPARDNRDGFAKALDEIIDAGGTRSPASHADRSAMGDGGSYGDGTAARVITLRPADIRQIAADDASGAAHAVFGR